ncbi:MAG: serine/threonine protein kinase [Isosphaerales bacterium]
MRRTPAQGVHARLSCSKTRRGIPGHLGGGGQGVVYKALQRGAVEQTVALKTLRAEGLAAEGDVAKFLQEMRLMTELDHPGLVSTLDSGIEDGRPFLAMPLMVGGSLTSRLKDGSLPDPKTAAGWMAGIARAVQYLHEKNMIHRDLKPANILFDAHGQARVADFGLVRLVEQAAGRPTEIPVELEAICLKCLATDPANRYDSAGKLADELDRFRHDLPLELTHSPGLFARLGRWARREPGLATRLTIVIGCTAVIGANWLSAVAGIYQPRTAGWSIGPVSGGPDSLRWVNLTLLFAWGLAAAGFQASLRRTRRAEALIRAWLSTDVVLATVLLIIDGQPMTPLTAVYPVLIAASGLWSRARVVAFTTALAMIGYVVLIAEGWASGKPIGYRYGHLDFLAGLATMGFIAAYQARRVRALGRLIDEGPEA